MSSAQQKEARRRSFHNENSAGSSSDDGTTDDYPSLSPAERQQKIRSYLLKEKILTKQHTSQGVPREIAVDLGKWPKKTNAAVGRSQSASLNRQVSAGSSRPVSHSSQMLYRPSSSASPGHDLPHPTTPAQTVDSRDDYEVEIDEDRFGGETQFERFLREEQEEEANRGIPTGAVLLREKAARSRLTPQDRKEKGFESFRGVTNTTPLDSWGAVGADGLIEDTHKSQAARRVQLSHQGVAVSNMHVPSTSSAVSNAYIEMRALSPETALPPRFHNDRAKYYASQGAVMRPTTATMVNHPSPQNRSAFGGAGGGGSSRHPTKYNPAASMHLLFPPNSSPHQTRKPFPGNYGSSSFSQLRGKAEPVKLAANQQPPRRAASSAAGVSGGINASNTKGGVWDRVYGGAVRVAPEHHPREREPNYSAYAGEDSATLALHIEQSKANAFFAVNRRPASALRQGTPLWDTANDDHLSIVSRSAARPHTSSLRGRKEEHAVEMVIRHSSAGRGGRSQNGGVGVGRAVPPKSASVNSSGVNSSTVSAAAALSSIPAGENVKNVALAKSKVRARLEGAATQAITDGQYEERQRFRAQQFQNGTELTDAPINSISAPLPKQKLLNALQRTATNNACNNGNNAPPTASVIVEIQEGEGEGEEDLFLNYTNQTQPRPRSTSLVRESSTTPKDYVPRPESGLSDASSALRKLIENANPSHNRLASHNVSRNAKSSLPLNNNSRAISATSRNQSSRPLPPTQLQLEEWFEHVTSTPEELSKQDTTNVVDLSTWKPTKSLGEQTSTAKCAITIVRGKAYLSHANNIAAQKQKAAALLLPPSDNEDEGENGRTGADGDDAAASSSSSSSDELDVRRSSVGGGSGQKRGVRGRPEDGSLGVPLVGGGCDSDESSDWDIDESDEDGDKYDLQNFSASSPQPRASRRSSTASGHRGGGGGARHSVVDAVDEYILSHQQRSGADVDPALGTRRQQLNRLKKKQLAQRKLQQQASRRGGAEHGPGIAHGSVQLPVYLTSRFSKSANITWDMSMEKPIVSSEKIEAEKRRFEE